MGSMALLYYVVDLFVKTMGITQPGEASRRRAAFFILGLMALTLVLVAGVGILLHSVMNVKK